MPTRSQPPGLVAPRRRRNRLDWLLLRWQARLDARWADRTVPWLLAGGLFVVYAGVAVARLERLDGGLFLARHVQAAWHLAEGNPPELTIGPDGNLFADRLPLLFVPLAALTRVLPVATTLVVVQAAAIAVGVVPVWLLARNVARLRVGAAGALAVAYGLHPAVGDLVVGDVHPQSFALSPLLGAAYFAEQRHWRRFALLATVAVLWSSELGLVVAAMGVVLLTEGERRAGIRALVAGLGWTLFALLAVQSAIGRTGLVAPGAFSRYGETGLDVLVQMVRNPFRIVADLLSEPEVTAVAWVLAPLAFLPLLALRKLAPALPLTVLVLVADVPVDGPNGAGRMVPLVAFSFVAATAALARLGRPSVERVIVDHRLLGIVVAASVAGMAVASPVSPYAHPWEFDKPEEAALRAALERLPPVVPARVPGDLATAAAEREVLEIVNPESRDAAALTRGVDALILDESTWTDLEPAERYAFRRAIAEEGLIQVYRRQGVAVFVRLSADGVVAEPE